MSEDWDPKKVAAECAAAARKKRQPRERLPLAAAGAEREGRDELGKFTEGHSFSAGDAHRGGRETKYKPEFCEQARKLARMGATVVEMADFFEVSLRSVYLWRNVHDEFAEAIKVGWKGAMDRATRSLYERAVGYDYVEEQAIKVRAGKDEDDIRIVEVRRHQPADTTALMYVHNNRDPDNWRHVRTVQMEGSIEHRVSPDDQRKALEDYIREVGGEIIDVTPIHLPAPELSAPEMEVEDDI